MLTPHGANPVRRRALLAVLTTVTVLCAVACIGLSARWPLVGDASLMHYVVFLLSKGCVPYKEVIDVNLPGTYVAEAASMKLFGSGAVGLRLYDSMLLLLMTVAMVLVARRRSWQAGVIAGALFAALHMQDGLAQAGQRDLLVSVLVVFAYAALFHARHTVRPFALLVVFGLLIGFSTTIKPFFAPLGLLLLIVFAWQRRSTYKQPLSCLLAGSIGFLLPIAGVFLWLESRGALGSFAQALTGIIPYHASLGRMPLFYLLMHSIAPIAPLVVIWFVLLGLRRQRPSAETLQLWLGIAVALAAYLMQGKGFPYQRYPLLALLLLAICMEFVDAWNDAGCARIAGLAGLTYACLLLAPLAVWRVHTFTTDRPFEQALTQDLSSLHLPLAGQIQCLDTYGGCINTLYDMHLVQATGFLYDCYLFTPGHDKQADLYRQSFWNAYQRTQPSILILTDQNCFAGSNFNKLSNWPQFDADLQHSYQQVTEWHSPRRQHWWSRQEQPTAFRIYRRHDRM